MLNKRLTSLVGRFFYLSLLKIITIMKEKLTSEILRERQSWSLTHKIDHSIGVLDQFIQYCGGKDNVYISFSGGKDSTVLLHLARKVFGDDIKAVFCNTRNEFPDIVRFVRSIPNCEIIYPELKPKEVIDKYGFPLVSKSVSGIVRKCKSTPNGKTYENFVVKRTSRFKLSQKWFYLLDEPYSISEQCCMELKKKPMKKYQKETGRYPITGEMAGESQAREMKYLQTGCNQFGDVINSKPLSIWTEKDIWDYIELYNVEISDIYKKGANRTGCVFCGFGCQFKDDNRLDMLYNLYPKFYNMAMNYSNNGFTFREAIRKILNKNNIMLPDEKNACVIS